MIEENLKLARQALKELIEEGKRVNVSAVEKRAGLSNGTLNYSHPLYEAFKEKICELKRAECLPSSKDIDRLRGKLNHEVALKEKYRVERDKLKEDIRVLMGEKAELQYQLFHALKLIDELECVEDQESNVLKYSALKSNKD
ncbi:hypothetical protein L1D59_17840 [Pseudoalteromonas piscicida]|uniref:hypothetical protein n=1 Tax=Pseudoalteromonas piscicida TaxID=43662 RepID=UPI001EFD7AC2|nr:hypothetical protein [Pseudoalteromonas piscicida]MCG9770459.1 hypothetical protein [Pseudoalteromonas piscicida]